jgi:hypothetical protein
MGNTGTRIKKTAQPPKVVAFSLPVPVIDMTDWHEVVIGASPLRRAGPFLVLLRRLQWCNKNDSVWVHKEIDMSLALGVIAAILMTLSPTLGYWFLLSHYLEQRQVEHLRTQSEVHSRIATRLAAIRGRVA